MISWNRFYDPETGRYISADPIGLTGGMNLYAYVEGNPVNWMDVIGLCRENGEIAWDCANRVAQDVLGDQLDILDGFGYWGISFKALSKSEGISLYASLVGTIATDIVRDSDLEGALTKGNILKKIAAANISSKNAVYISRWNKGLSLISKGTGILGYAATGGSALMRILRYFYGDCDEECPCNQL